MAKKNKEQKNQQREREKEKKLNGIISSNPTSDTILIELYEWFAFATVPSTQLSNIRDELFREFFVALENIMYHVYLLNLCAFSVGRLLSPWPLSLPSPDLL